MYMLLMCILKKENLHASELLCLPNMLFYSAVIFAEK